MIGSLAAFPAHALERVLKSRRAGWIGILGFAAALKITLAWRGLIQAGASVARDLKARESERVRDDLRALVSRDTQSLDAPLLAAAAIESLAENAGDAFVAPLFYYLLFGLPGAFVYRAVNTMDSMIGYHGRYEYLGKVAARLDDALNLIPARLTAVLLTVAAWLTRGTLAPRDFRRDRCRRAVLRGLWHTRVLRVRRGVCCCNRDCASRAESPGRTDRRHLRDDLRVCGSQRAYSRHGDGLGIYPRIARIPANSRTGGSPVAKRASRSLHTLFSRENS